MGQARIGPHARGLRPCSPDGAMLAAAPAATARDARTFTLACRLLPRDVYLLYLVFRTLDDLVDDRATEAEERVAAVERRASADEVTSPEPRILAGLDLRHRLPREEWLDFCAGMRHDLEGRELRTAEDVERYCHQVAGTVGLVMLTVLGVRSDAAEAQRSRRRTRPRDARTNTQRDIDEDLAAGGWLPCALKLGLGKGGKAHAAAGAVGVVEPNARVLADGPILEAAAADVDAANTDGSEIAGWRAPAPRAACPRRRRAGWCVRSSAPGGRPRRS